MATRPNDIASDDADNYLRMKRALVAADPKGRTREIVGWLLTVNLPILLVFALQFVFGFRQHGFMTPNDMFAPSELILMILTSFSIICAVSLIGVLNPGTQNYRLTIGIVVVIILCAATLAYFSYEFLDEVRASAVYDETRAYPRGMRPLWIAYIASLAVGLMLRYASWRVIDKNEKITKNPSATVADL